MQEAVASPLPRDLDVVMIMFSKMQSPLEAIITRLEMSQVQAWFPLGVGNVEPVPSTSAPSLPSAASQVLLDLPSSLSTVNLRSSSP